MKLILSQISKKNKNILRFNILYIMIFNHYINNTEPFKKGKLCIYIYFNLKKNNKTYREIFIQCIYNWLLDLKKYYKKKYEINLKCK